MAERRKIGFGTILMVILAVCVVAYVVSTMRTAGDIPYSELRQYFLEEDCVNAVGVDVNTASASLLGRVAGLNGTTAKNIVKYREENGAFTTRRQLLKVPKVGPKAFQQCAGFLRVPESRNVLDHTGVHPESYPAAEQLLTLCGYTAADVGAAAMSQLPELPKPPSLHCRAERASRALSTAAFTVSLVL